MGGAQQITNSIVNIVFGNYQNITLSYLNVGGLLLPPYP
jgi:hypothetical protein